MTIDRAIPDSAPGAIAADWWGRARNFFRFHGVWAPGVRLMRRWSFRTKLLLVLMLMAVPLLFFTVHMLLAVQGELERAEHRLAGTRLSDASYTMASAFSEEWLARLAGRPAQPADLAPSYRQLLSAVADGKAAGLDLQFELEARLPDIERIVAPGNAAQATRTEHLRQALVALETVHARAVDTSGVLVSGDLILNAKAQLGFSHLPELQIDVAKLRAGVSERALLLAADPRPAVQLQANAVDLYGVLEAATRSLHEVDRDLARLPSTAATQQPLPALHRMLGFVRAGALAADERLDPEAMAAQAAAARNEVQALRVALSGELQLALEHQRQIAETSRLALALALVATLVVSLYAFYSLYLVMNGGLGLLTQQMDRMSRGDLSARLNPHGNDEVARTMRAMTKSLVSLSDLLAAVREGVSSVRQASQQIAGGNADLSTRNRATTAGLEHLVSAVATYSAQLEACGRQVETVVGSVQALRLQAASNRKQMGRLSERLQSLRGKSREIGEIVTLIDAIAFRTNILALNASVEASKAGEAGRGFAVVAQEVRSLAQRSADSARRIGDIVARSTDDIERSGELADETGRAMGAADEHVGTIHSAMNDVATLSRQGEKQSADILSEITDLKHGTAQNLRLVDQLAQASGALRSQGERLMHRVSQFRLS